MLLKEGMQLAGKYEILKEINRGGMAIVYLAMDLHIHKMWAIKAIKKKQETISSFILLQAWQQEADLLKELDHPGLPRIVDIVETMEELCIVMDYIDGRSLDDLVKHEGAQPSALVLSWGKQLCDILHYLHTQKPMIIYRDLKPANIMVKAQGDIRLIDFGIARRYCKEKQNDTDVLGTQGYASPEQFSRVVQSDERSDIYALGATLFHVASGYHPLAFGTQRPKASALNPEIPEGLANVLERCMAVSPKQRYQSIAEVQYALAHAEEYDLAYRREKQHRLLVIVLCLLSIALCLAGGRWALSYAQQLHALTYEGLLKKASQEHVLAKRKTYLHQAIHLLPQQETAYRRLLQLYEEDGIFSYVEEADLKRHIQPYMKKTFPFYGELCFQIGKLYWYYYETQEDSQPPLARMKAAYFWFHEVDDKTCQGKHSHVEMAQAYARIGAFHQNITLRIEEVEDSGMYKTCFSDIQRMYQENKVQRQAEIVALESDRMMVSLLTSYARGFYLDGITKAQMLTQLHAIQQDADRQLVTTTKTKQLRKTILTMCKTGEKLIHYAYVKEKQEEKDGRKNF